MREVEATACSRPVIVCTDSHNLADTVQFDAGTTSDKRLRIVTAMLRQTFAANAGMTLRWVSTHEMYADALAKVMVALAVIAIMSSKSPTRHLLAEPAEPLHLLNAPLLALPAASHLRRWPRLQPEHTQRASSSTSAGG